MLCCETGGTARQDVEDLAVFVSQLAALGVTAAVDVRSVPDDLHRNTQFDLAPYLFDGPLEADDQIVLIAANRLTDDKLIQLRRFAGAASRVCVAFGAFESQQALIGARSKLSYVFGEDPRLFNVAESAPNETQQDREIPVFGVLRNAAPESVPRLLVIAPDLRDGPQASALVSLTLSRRFHTSILTDGKSKQQWIAAHGADIDFYHYGEVLPADLAERVDICVSFAPPRENYRLRCLMANLAVSGAALIDATPNHGIARASDAFIRGPLELLSLGSFVTSEIIPNLGQIAAHTLASKFAERHAPAAVLRFLDAKPRPRAPMRPANSPARAVFMPTNGIGLGHAQRCALVAAALDPALVAPVFAAFPSCAKLLKSNGFDVMPLIGRSALHAQTHENDLTNYLRLRALTAGAQALVFDGGYVFDSIYRSILENGPRCVWIRRGLWQSTQDNSVALDREKIFDRVIVPSEVFEELNASYSRGDHLRVVGPIVQRIDLDPERRTALRDSLAARFDRGFDRLVVSLLGAGVAADRGAQIQALCGMMERRADTLHLVVVWPTAILQPVWFDWAHSRVVKTHSAGVLAAAADLCVSAAGYNSFHEAMYNGVPTIFIPQTGSFMDDQRTRARAASGREVAGMVEPNALMMLEREVCRFLDEGKAETVRANLAALELPEPGTEQAARLIEEVSNGFFPALERHIVADRPAGRG